jgi:hypothetical protein
MTTWHKGPPPSIGWWPASVSRSPKILRWWNGEYWSRPAREGTGLDQVAEIAALKSTVQNEIEWTDRPADWPLRSRT